MSTAAERPELHAELRPLAGLVGTWEGRGEGHYPTIDDFGYLERVTVDHVGTPVLRYEQRTRHPERGHPMHAEVGYLRMAGPEAVELVVAHPTGLVEVQEGRLEGDRLELASTTVAGTATAKDVRSLRREITLHGDRLAYDLWMSHGDVDDAHHLSAELHRVG